MFVYIIFIEYSTGEGDLHLLITDEEEVDDIPDQGRDPDPTLLVSIDKFSINLFLRIQSSSNFCRLLGE